MRITKEYVTAVCMSLMLLTGLTGCTKTVESSRQTQEEIGDEIDSGTTQEDKGGGADGSITQEKADDRAEQEAREDNFEESGEAQDDQSVPVKVTSNEGTEFLGGKVQSVKDDGMILAQTTVLDEEDASMVTLVDEKDAKKISVKFTADTKVEHWTIRGGGAGIDMRDAALSDLTAGMGVELEGYFEGETFVAARVLIEE